MYCTQIFERLSFLFFPRDILLFCALFCFSQDLDPDQRGRMEDMAREELDCFQVPIQESLYEYLYEGGR